MIEKLDIEPIQSVATNHCIINKINELVDAVNELKRYVEFTEPNLADPYAEQRKWVGKLCKFWDYDGEEKWFSVLEHIDKNTPYPYCASGDWWYKHCEPVKPDEDIIYKAGYATTCPHCRHTIPKHVVREAQAELKRVMQK